MKPDPSDLDAFQASLAQPMQAQLAAVRGALFGAACGPGGADAPDEELDFWIDDEVVSASVDAFLARLGRTCLSSPAFWSQYDLGRQGGLAMAEALNSAAETHGRRI
jgi:hypothetical protein